MAGKEDIIKGRTWRQGYRKHTTGSFVVTIPYEHTITWDIDEGDTIWFRILHVEKQER